MLVVADTNILVSSLWSRNGAPARFMSMILAGTLIPCYDYRILEEYRSVLMRPKFGFSKGEVNALLGWFAANGFSVTAAPINMHFADEEDRKFFEVARFCNAMLVTGNLKHFPEDPMVVSVTEFLTRFS